MLNTSETIHSEDPMLVLLRQRLLEMGSTQPEHHVVQRDNGIIQIGFHYIITGYLASHDRNTALSDVDKLLADVLELRKQFPPAKASDIYLFLSAPSGSIDNPEWGNLAAEIERDDRLARKQVWLPNADGSNFSDLIDSSFLAKPWAIHKGSTKELDLITDNFDLPLGWENILLKEDLAGEVLIEALLQQELENSHG